MRASAYSQADCRRREPAFAARKRGGASPAAHVLGERTRKPPRGRSFLGARVFAAPTATLFIGWRDSEEGHLTPERCVGRWLSIAGASVMLLLLLYHMRRIEHEGCSPRPEVPWVQ